MYTKVFRSIYDGTLADNWQAMVTFQQLLILANDEGVVDMTIGAIHRTTGIPIDILTAGIAVLEAPDHGSRTPDMEGRRISRLEDHRDWGWFLVNFKKYRKMITRDEKKEADRERIAQQREAEKSKQNSNVANCSVPSQGVASCSELSQVSHSVADVAHTEAERETEKDQNLLSDADASNHRPSRFGEFWSEYPSKVGRKPCETKWRAKKLDRVADVILGDVRRRKSDDRRWRDGFVPNPETYLNQERWNDGDVGSTRNSAGPQAKAEQPDWMLGAV